MLLAALLERAPDYRVARQEYAFVLVELHRYQEAREQLDLLLRDEPESVALKTLYAAACVGLGEHERAIELYRELLRGVSQDAEAHLSIGHAREDPRPRAGGDRAPTSRRPRAVATSAMPTGVSPISRPTASPTRSWRRCAPRSRRPRPRSPIATTCALRSARRSRIAGEYAESFRHYQLGNELKRPECRYRAELIETNTQQQIQVCTREFFAARSRLGEPEPGSDLHHRAAALGLDAP